jgi:hypothetical protein
MFLAMFWAVCAVFNYGTTFACLRGRGWQGEEWPLSEQKEVSRRSCAVMALLMAVFGPIGTLTVLMRAEGLKYGWRSY